jgi:hypothetical protein
MVAIKQFRDSDSYVSLFEMQKYLSELMIKALESLGCQHVFRKLSVKSTDNSIII